MGEEVKKEEAGFRRLTSRKFLVTIGAMLLGAVCDAFGIALSDATVNIINVFGVSFLGVEGIKDGLVAWKTAKPKDAPKPS